MTTDERIEAYLAGDLAPDERTRFEEEVLASDELAERVHVAAALVEELDAARAALRVARRRGPRRAMAAVGAVAAVLALVVVGRLLESPGFEPNFRGDAPPAIGLAPEGTVDAFPRTFRWSPAERASDVTWRLEIYDADARRRFTFVTADTLRRFDAAAPGDSVGTWDWLVIELRPDGSEGGTSEATSFTVRGRE